MKRTHVLLLAVLAVTVWCSTAFATEYFVATTGNDSNAGTIGSPWKTINKALNTVVAGDTVSVRAGTYAENARFRSDGTSSNWITLRSYDGDLAAKISDGLYVQNNDYIRMIGFECSSTSAMPIHIAGGWGPDYTPPSERAEHIDVLRCYFHDPAFYDCVKVNQSDYILFEDCEMTGPSGDEQLDTVWMSYSTIRRCYVHDYYDVAVTLKGGALYSVMEDTIISHAVNAGDKASRFGGSTDTEFQNPNSNFGSEYTVYRNNIIRDVRAPAVGDYECNYCYFYNNTVVDCGSSLGIVVHHADPPYTLDGGSHHVYFYNNVFLDTAGDMGTVYYDQSGLPIEDWVHDYNNYYNNGNPIPAGSWTGHNPNTEAHSTFGNPNLANQNGTAGSYAGWKNCYRITASSTLLIDRGSSTAGNSPRPAVVHDIDGNARPQGAGYDIGAFEYVSGGGSPPVANFTGNPTSGTAPLTVAFTDTSTNTPTSWSWTFGDSATSTARNPSHVYTSAGTYTVALTATNSYGSNTNTKNSYISVSAGGSPPVANFTGTPTSGTAPLAVAFTDTSTNTPTSWSWTFGDSSTSTAQNPSHTYSSAGTYNVALTATNAYGANTNTKNNYITVSSGGTPVTIFADHFASGLVGWTLIDSPDACTCAGQGLHMIRMRGSEGIQRTISTAGYTNIRVSFALRLVTTTEPGEYVQGLWYNGSAWTVLKQINDGDADNDGLWHSYQFDLPAGANNNANFALKFYTSADNVNYDDDGLVDNVVVQSTAAAAPVANFTGSPTSGAAPLAVAFTDTSTNSPTSWNWTFGDSSTSTAQNPSHTYTTAGTYTVALTATNATGSNTNTKTNYIAVTVPAPVANFTGTPTSGTVPLAVSFTDTSTNTPTSWSWTFGDSGTSTTRNPSHTYNSAGTYTVALTATNAGGSNTNTKTNYITANPPAPVANFSGTPTSGTAPLAVSFTDTSTNTPTSWSWTFGDTGTSTVKNPSHTYNSAGTYTVALTATNAGGSNTNTKTNYLTVTVAAPVANFTGTPTSGVRPLTVSFTDTSTNAPTSWSWTFGDTGTSTVKNPSHTYNSAGTYTVALTATNAGGSNTNTKTNYITATVPAPVANFTGTPTSGTVPLAVTFTDTSTNTPTSWSWTFGDSTTATTQNPSHTYSTAGTYTVALTATNAGGSNTNTKTNYITASSGGTQVTIFSDHFANGLTGWTLISSPDACTCSSQGLHLIRIRGSEGMNRTISTSGYTSIVVSFQMQLATTTETGEYIQALWYNGTTWTVMKQINHGDADGDGQFHSYQYTLPSGANNNPNFALKFYVSADNVNYDDEGKVDNLVVKGTH